MTLKLNLPVPKTSTAIHYYEELFGGTIIKDGKNDGHSYIKIFDKVSLHLHSKGKIPQNDAYFILRFEEDEKDSYIKTLENIKSKVEVEITRENEEMVWGTTLTKFKDKYGYQWVLEINS